MPEPIQLLKQERLKKIEKIKELGVDPFPSHWEYQDQREPIAFVRQKELETKVIVSGRIVAWREHGALIFANLKDESGQTQLLFNKAQLSQVRGDSLEYLLELLDLGDFLGVLGKLIKTKAGELTVEVESFTLLAKSLRPLPSQFYGLKDVEERYRHRYLDILFNEGVKNFFILRSRVVEEIRQFLIKKKGYLEVETPILHPIYGGGLARPFKTHHFTLDQELFLRISTELYLKRLIVGGLEKVFEINRVFRNEGVDFEHNPEFTLLETMEAYADYQKNMGLVEEIFETVVQRVFNCTTINYSDKEIDFKRPWKKVMLWDLIKEKLNIDFNTVDLDRALTIAKKYNLGLNEYEKTVGFVSIALFEEVLAKDLIQPTLVTNYPYESAPLAKRWHNDKRLVENFEIYIGGIECGTNYSELNDPLELRERLIEEKKKEKLGNEETHQMDEDFLEALEYGMPPTSGIGPGIDRVVMILANAKSIREVILFPTLRGKP